MEQLLHPECQGPLLLFAQIRGDIFGGRAEGRGLMPVTQITEISLTWDHKSSFFHSKVVSVWGLCPWTPLGDFCPPHPLDLLPRKDLLGSATGQISSVWKCSMSQLSLNKTPQFWKTSDPSMECIACVCGVDQ